jgi:hypothetical protein
MAEDAKRKIYPRIPTKNWWDLRRKFRQSQPRQLTPAYLQTVLGVQEGAAKNLIPQLRTIGFIDEDGRPSAQANNWRSDDHYAGVCKALVEKLYPDELRDALPGPKPDRGKVKKWFLRETRTGEGAAKQMAAFYVLLCEADPAAQDQKADARRTPPKQKAQRPKTVRRSEVTGAHSVPAQPAMQPTATGGAICTPMPSLHIDIQVHIAADASADQIDQVFASMAKHLYGKP